MKTSHLKIAFIGGGSLNWCPKLACDLFSTKSLANSRLALVDINRDNLDIMHRYCSELAKHINTGWQIETADMDSALDKADCVIVSISTGGFEAMDQDYKIPLKYGVYHSVGDTVGPGGISRTLRNVPVFLDIARHMEKRCPDAWMVHVTNPLAQLTRAVTKCTGIKAVGLCHNWHGTRTFLAKFFGCETDELQAVSVGVNHFTWLKEISCRGKIVDPAELTVRNYLDFELRQKGKPIQTNTTDDAIEAAIGDNIGSNYLLNFELYEQLGIFPVGAPSHVAENFSFYLDSDNKARLHRIRRKGVLPNRVNYTENNRKRIQEILDGKQPYPDAACSNEEVAPVVDSLCTGLNHRVMVNLPNSGQITNIQPGVVVETWALAGNGSITPIQSGAVPIAVNGFVQSIISEEELAVDAALSGRKEDLIKALVASPLLNEKYRAGELADELLDLNRAYSKL